MAESIINEGILIPIIAIAGTFTWLIIATLASCLKSMFAIWRHTRLKERMLERGLTVNEIERIMVAGKTRVGNSCKKKGAAQVSAEALDMHGTQAHY